MRRTGIDRDAFEAGENIEQRIARHRHEHAIAGVAQEPEEVRVRLARAGAQNDPRHVDVVLPANRVASARITERLRVVGKRAGVGERGEQFG